MLKESVQQKVKKPDSPSTLAFFQKTLTEHLVFIVRLICPTSLWQRASSLPAWKKGESGCSVKNDLESGRRGLAVLRYSLYDATARYIL